MEITTWTGRETRMLRESMRLTVEAFAEVVDAAPRTVSYWEAKGRQTKPRPFNQSVLDTIFARLDDASKGRFASLLSGEQGAHRDAEAIVAAEKDRAVPVGAGLLIPMVRGSTIEQIHMAAEMFGSWNNRAGSFSTSDAANAQMTWGRSLIGVPCSTDLHRDFHASLAHLGLVAGFINFDAHSHTAATSVFEFALQRARDAGDPHLQVKVMSHQARQAIYCNQSERALRILDQALQLPDLTATEKTMLFTGRARAYAKAGRVREAWADIRSADTEFERSNLLTDRSWMQYYDQAQHLGDTGHALFDLAVEGQFASEALDRLGGAVAGHSGDYARSKAMSLLKVASLQFAVGDPARAVTTADQGLPVLSAIGSGRVVDQLHELLRYSLAYAGDTAVSRLRAQIGALLP